MKNLRQSIIVVLAIIVIGTPYFVSIYPNAVKKLDSIFSYIGNNYTAVFLHTPVITVAQLKDKFNSIK